MKKLLVVVGLLALGFVLFVYEGTKPERASLSSPVSTLASDDTFAKALAQHRGNFVAEGAGNVVRILADDNDGSRHQRFIVELSSGQSLLIAHNIDLAPRVESLRVGDEISFKGEYEWNDKGGVMHWTHRDPAGRHEPGWIHFNGKTYQ